MTISLSQLTDNSWIAKSNDTYGILFKQNDIYNLKTSTVSVNFSSIKDIEKKYGKISYEERELPQLLDNINGFPVKDKNYVIVESEIPKYVKKNNYNQSKIEFYAGYWSIKYPNGWALNLCPKVATTEQYESQGPYRTKLECTNNNNLLNTRENVKKL